MDRILPVGKQNFKEIRQKGYVYVDKTRYVWELARTGLSYFLSRPRRFGKSLLVSTFESYFSGEKELFKGLYIEEKENERGDDAWTEYPVISFYLSGGQFNEPDGLKNKLSQTLNDVQEKYGLEYLDSDLSSRFSDMIKQLYEKTGHQVVVLVDEYDKPLLSTMISNPEQEEKNRELYKSFFSVLKDMDGYLRFVFFTGVTKFTKVSIFSDLNQLIDISMYDEYSGVCGITEEEMRSEFKPEIEALAEKKKLTYDECLAKLQQMYDGYHFSADGIGVYNPYSLLSAFMIKNFKRFWFGTGTPDILIKTLQNSTISLVQIVDGVGATEDEIMNYRVEYTNPVPLFYQTGYLTICGYDSDFDEYSLRFPNDEVKYGFLNSLIPITLGQRDEENPSSLKHMLIDLKKGNPESL